MTKKATQRKTRKPGAVPVSATRAYRIVIIKDGQFVPAPRRKQSVQVPSVR